MGCFNVACGLSGISMYTDRAALIPLIPADYAPARGKKGEDEDKKVSFSLRGADIISNEGPQALYVPLTLPIFGKLNSYGRLESIEADANTKAIEKFWKMKIEKFAEIVAYGEMPDRSNPNDPWLRNIAGMFVHREIWDHFAVNSFDEFGKSDYYVYEDGDLTDEVLALVGFRFEREDKSRDRYNRLMSRKDMPGVEIWSDQQWIRLEISGKKYESVYKIADLIKTIEKHSTFKFPPAQLRRIKSTPKWAPLIEESLNARDEQKKELAEHRKQLTIAKRKKDPKLIRIYESLIELKEMQGYGLSRNPDMFTLGSRYSAVSKLFEELYGHDIKGVVPLLMKHRQVQMALFSCNRLYMPTFNGYQHGNHGMSEMLYEKSAEIVKAKLKADRDEADEDGEEDDE